MLQRLIAAVLGVLGLVAIALGIASATAWRADDTLTASARAADGTTLVTTAPGVLRLGDPPVTIRASAEEGTKVVVALGRETDVEGWVGTDPHTVITGLEDWHTLTVKEAGSAAADAPAEGQPAEGEGDAAEGDAAEGDAAEPAAPTSAPDPDGSDLWVDQVTGDGEAEMVWTPEEGRWTVLVAGVGDSAVAPTVELSWPQTVTTPWLLPGVIGGSVLVLIALALFLHARRSARAVTAGDTGVDGGAPVVASSRRERRAAAHAARERETERSASTAPVPVLDRPSSVTPSTDAPATDAPATHAPATGGPASGAPSTDAASSVRPAGERAGGGRPAETHPSGPDEPTQTRGPAHGPRPADGEEA